MAERCPSSSKKEPGFNVSFMFRDGDMILRSLEDFDSSTNFSPSSPSPSPPPDSGTCPSKEASRRQAAMLSLYERARYRKPRPPRILRTVAVWEDGFVVQGGPFRSLDDPQNARFLEDIKNSICPEELLPEDKSIRNVDICVKTSARNCPEAAKHPAFRRVGND